jgi:hypothetical protein
MKERLKKYVEKGTATAFSDVKEEPVIAAKRVPVYHYKQARESNARAKRLTQLRKNSGSIAMH